MRKIKSLLAVGAMAMVFTLAQPVTPTSKLANQVSHALQWMPKQPAEVSHIN